MTQFVSRSEIFLLSIAIGGFLYIAGSDLIPELHKTKKINYGTVQHKNKHMTRKHKRR